MTIEEKIEELKIKKVLIADDLSENIQASKEYFNRLDLKVDYASSAKEAKEMIKKSYKEDNSYSLVLSDLQMEEQKSGLEVVREGYKHLIMSYIITGANYNNTTGHGHGPSTRVEPDIGSVKGRKDKPEVWEKIFEKVIDNMREEERPLYDSMTRFRKFISKPSDKTADLCMLQYKHLERQIKND